MVQFLTTYSFFSAEANFSYKQNQWLWAVDGAGIKIRKWCDISVYFRLLFPEIALKQSSAQTQCSFFNSGLEPVANRGEMRLWAWLFLKIYQNNEAAVGVRNAPILFLFFFFLALESPKVRHFLKFLVETYILI